MSILPTWPIAAGALVVGLVAGAGLTANVKNEKIARIEKTHADEKRKMAEQREAEQQLARTIEQSGSIAVTRALQEKENEKAAIADRLADAEQRLRERPARRVVVAGPAAANAPDCKGSTGASLSAEDSVFLSREATRADALRADLAACYKQYDEVKAGMDRYADELSRRPAASTGSTPR